MDTKVCTKCGKEFPIVDFNWRDKKKGTRRSECKYCHNTYMNEKNNNNRSVIQNLKESQCCKKCGEQRWYLLDYHHLDPSQKTERIAKLMIRSSLDITLNEIQKCILLCSNCHREFHYFEKENGITIEEYLA